MEYLLKCGCSDVLSDETRKEEYDDLLASQSYSSADPSDSSNYFHSFASAFFTENAQGPPPAYGSSERKSRPNADETFSSVFEELLRPEVHRIVPLYTWLGAAAGAGIGFIVANLPGAAVGAFAGESFFFQ